MDRQRQFGMSVQPLSFADIGAWAALFGERPEPWEAWALLAMDRIRLSELGKEPPPPQISGEAFDGLFG